MDLEEFFTGVLPHLDERQRRLVAGNLAMSLGHGGIVAVAEAASMSRSTVQTAIGEIDAGVEVTDRVRAPGAGRAPIWESQPGVVQALDDLVEPTSRGCPMCPLRWTSKSTRKLAAELKGQGFTISHTAVGNLLRKLGYSLQAVSKTREGDSHPDRDAQFSHLAAQVAEHLEAGDPVISVDTKKKELVGDYHNAGVEYQPVGEPVEVNDHDFPEPGTSKAVPYGVYDLAANEGWVSVGDDGDTAQFAVATIERWWNEMGSLAYPDTSRLLITADAGGSNSYRSRLWKRELAALAERTGLTITVNHFPPGTSKWNKIEHRMFNHITMNWRGRPLTSYDTIVSLIANTTHHNRAHHQRRPRPRSLPNRHQNPSQRNHPTPNHRPAHPPPLARRLELHHQPHPNHQTTN